MRWLFRLLVLAILLAVALLLLKDVLLEEYLEARLRRATGLEVRIDRLEAGLLHPVLTLEGVRVYNPAEFGGAPCLEAAEVHLEYRRVPLARGTLQLALLRLRITELLLVEDARGALNLPAVAARIAATTRANGGPDLAFGGIDTLNLTVERIRRQTLRDPTRQAAIQPPVRGMVLQNLRTGPDLARALTDLAWRSGAGPILGLTPVTNTPPAGPPR